MFDMADATDTWQRFGALLRLQQALIVRLVLRVNWWQVLEGVEESLVLLETT